jgi:hypothetical protein
VRFALLALLLSPSIASAELPTFIPSSVAPEPDRPFIFAAPHLGLNAPLGLLGGELGVGYDWFRASAGAGIALGGPQVGATVRAMTGFSSIDAGIGVGISRGGALHELDISFGDRDPNEMPGTVQYDGNTIWLNL